MKGEIVPIVFSDNAMTLIDQRKIPTSEEYIKILDIESCHWAIKEMVVRGAPCIGFTAIYGMALWAKNNKNINCEELELAANYLKSARPTAVNLEFEIDRCVQLARKLIDKNKCSEIYKKLISFGDEQMILGHKNNLKMAKLANVELTRLFGSRKLRLMTHCNTGTLACGTLGTALGVISNRAHLGGVEKVWVDETRPYMQGSRLTSFELLKEQIPHQIVVEGAASHLMREGLVDAIFVGADRITLNGDTANKIGTSTLAIVAQHYSVPFYVVAPTSSFDFNCYTGKDINIELRDEDEILNYKDRMIAAKEARALNPSFDITPNHLITGIICEQKFLKAPYLENITNLYQKQFT